MVAAVLLSLVLCSGAIAATVARNRNVQPPSRYFLLGAVLPLVGILIAALVPPTAPPGMTAVNCPRCNARQILPKGAGKLECRRCHGAWQWPPIGSRR